MTVIAAEQASNSFRIDHNLIDNLAGRGITTRANGHELSGVIDNNTLDAPGDQNVQGIAVFGSGTRVGYPFARPYSLGSSSYVFIEDNIFQFGGGHDGALDAYGGARYVFRYNTVTGTLVGHHGADSGGYRGVHSFELYGNTFDRTGFSGNERGFSFRSGSGVIYDNEWSGSYRNFHLSNYRSGGTYPVWGTCDGNSVYDGNTAGRNGYPCLDQIGHVFTDDPVGDNGSNQSAGLYIWGNRLNQSAISIDVAAGAAAHVLENESFYLDQGPPSNYTPYQYPHPLQSSGAAAPAPPSPPSNLRIVGN